MHSSAQPDPLFPDENPGLAGRRLDESELHTALQLLVERAQYITGATGATLALPEGDEMVCCASTGSSAPPVGARLQVRSGLTGESIARRQLLRCDNAENDPRVNLETCREMGIASIVVMPLVRRDGQVCGLFELFSDHAYAFEERDLSALERMCGLTLTALDLSESRPQELGKGVFLETAQRDRSRDATAEAEPPAVVTDQLQEATQQPSKPEISSVKEAAFPLQEESALPVIEPAPAVPEAMRRVQKCSSCGFPVSEGRSICLDCEKKQAFPEQSQERIPAEYVPAFLTSAAPPKQSWLADHVNLLAILVVVLGVLVAIVVFR